MDDRLILSEKYKAFLRCDAPVEFLEGTTAAGKTTVGLFKFMLKVAESLKKIHILAGLDLGTIEKTSSIRISAFSTILGAWSNTTPGARARILFPICYFIRHLAIR